MLSSACRVQWTLAFLRSPSLLCAWLLYSACVPDVLNYATTGAPAGISYAENPADYLRGQPIADNMPSVKGRAASLFSVNPSLPVGLILDPASGIISGTPSAVTPRADYVVTASNGDGSVRVTLSLAVSDEAPRDLNYTPNTLVLVRQDEVLPVVPTLGGGAATAFVSEPPLPQGLSLRLSDGAILGRPLVVTPEGTYTIRASNAFGTVSASVTIAVNDIPPSLTFLGEPFLFIVNRPINTGAPDNLGGVIKQCTVSPDTPLPLGLSTSPQSCAIFGTPSVVTPQASYTLVLEYAGGSVTQQVNLSVNPTLGIYPSSATVPAAVDEKLTFVGEGGAPPYSFQVRSGPGSIDVSTGVYSAPSVSGQTTIVVTDLYGAEAVASVTNSRHETNGSVRAILADTTGRYLGGDFSAVFPYAVPRVTALDLNSGNPDLRMDFRDGFDGQVACSLVVGNAVYVGGSFSKYRGRFVSRLVKLDARTGELDDSFATSTTFDGPVMAVHVMNDALYVGGNFSSYKSSPARGLAKLNRFNGALDTTFTQANGLAQGTFGTFARSFADDGTSLFVGGEFGSYRLVPTPALLKLDPQTGAQVSGFTSRTVVSASVRAMRVIDSRLWIAGDISTYDSTAVGNLVMVSLATGAMVDGASSFNSTVESLEVGADAVFVGGKFTTFTRGGTETTLGLAKLNRAGNALVSAFSAGSGISCESLCSTPSVNTLLLLGDVLYVGGVFANYRHLLPDAAAAQNLLRVNANSGALDTSFTRTRGLSGEVRSLALADSRLIVLGDFSFYRGKPAQHLAKFSLSDGSLDVEFTQSTGFDFPVSSLAANASAVFVGGEFGTYRGQTALRLAKLNPTSGDLDTVFTTATGFPNGDVQALLLGDTYLVVGGSFLSYRGTNSKALVKINSLTTGAIDATFSGSGFSISGAAYVTSLIHCFPQKFCVGGRFSTWKGAAVSDHLVALNDTNGMAESYFSDFNAPISALAYDQSGLYVAGRFSLYGAAAVNGLIRLTIVGGVGTLVAAFDSGLPANTVNALLVAFNRLYIAGPTTYQGSNVSGVVALDIQDSWSLIPSFNQLPGFNVPPTVIAQVGGTIGVGGAFSTYAGASVGSSVSLDPVIGLPSN